MGAPIGSYRYARALPPFAGTRQVLRLYQDGAALPRAHVGPDGICAVIVRPVARPCAADRLRADRLPSRALVALEVLTVPNGSSTSPNVR